MAMYTNLARSISSRIVPSFDWTGDFEATAPALASTRTLRGEIIRVALAQWARWKQGQLKEAHPGAIPILQDYWKTGVGRTVATSDLSNSAWQGQNPWSAAFISWVMRTAGAGTRFKYSAAHRVYISAAKKSRLAGDTTALYWAYRVSEATPQPGDVVCQWRNSATTYDNVDDGKQRPTHGDIVVEAGPGKILVVGGNVDQSVTRKPIHTTATGFLDAARHPQAFAVLKLRDGQPALAGRPSVAPGLDLDQAVRKNRFYAANLGWNNRIYEIQRLLGFVNMSPSEQLLAESVARWQAARGLSADGMIGPATWKALKAELERSTVSGALVPTSSTRPPSLNLDEAIRKNEFYGASLGWAKRIYDVLHILGFTNMSPDARLFAEAVARWQATHGLVADGVIGPATWTGLKKVLEAPRASSAATAPAVPTGSGQAGTLASTTFGTLTVKAHSYSYRFSDQDALWTARFIVGEAGGRDNADNRAVIWAMFNRYALFTNKVYPTFSGFLRNYSTTLQPVLKSWGAAQRHIHDKTFVRMQGTYTSPSAPPGIPRGQLQRYIDLQNTPWTKLPLAARSLAEAALKGAVKNPGVGIASEFANTKVYFKQAKGRAPTTQEWRKFTEAHARKKKWTWIGPNPLLDQIGQNAFFIDNRVKHLSSDSVVVLPP